jgi:hypothetical protein
MGRHSVPAESHAVHAGLDPNGAPCVWMSIPADMDRRGEVEFSYIGTGHQYESDMRHVGSFVHGDFVWHVMAREIKP